MSERKRDESGTLGKVWEVLKKNWWKLLAAYFVLKRKKKK